MPTQRLAPGAILERVNLNGQLSAIQDDPDFADGSWLTVATAGSDVFLRVAFPTPSGDLIGQQEIRAQVRKTSQTSAPTCELVLYQSGIQVASLSGPTTITGVTVVSGTFDASLITDPVNIEARINGLAGGGSPSKRASLEVGAIEYNANYQVAVESHSGAVAISGGGSVTTTGLKAGMRAVTVSGGGALLAFGLAQRVGSVVINGGGSILSTGSTALLKAESIVLSGGGAVTVIGRKSFAAAMTISSGGSVASMGRKQMARAIAISAGGSVVASGIANRTAAVLVSGGGTIRAFAQGVVQQVRGVGRGLLMGVGR